MLKFNGGSHRSRDFQFPINLTLEFGRVEKILGVCLLLSLLSKTLFIEGDFLSFNLLFGLSRF